MSFTTGTMTGSGGATISPTVWDRSLTATSDLRTTSWVTMLKVRPCVFQTQCWIILLPSEPTFYFMKGFFLSCNHISLFSDRGWVGWKNEKKEFVEIIFEFETIQEFYSIVLCVSKIVSKMTGKQNQNGLELCIVC